MDALAYSAMYGLVMLALGAWSVSEGADILSRHYDASVVGGLVIAWMNTAPETIFFLVALHGDKPAFAIGALAGSVMVVCTIALGLGIFIGASQSRVGSISLDKSVRTQAKILALTIPLFIFIFVDGFCISFGLIGILEYAVFVWYSLRGSKGSSIGVKDKVDVEGGGRKGEEEDEPSAKGFMFLFIGGLIIWLFSDDFIDSVVELGTVWRINPVLLAFFFAPIASEAPEILESVSLSLKGTRDSTNVAVSNLIGGTISKTTLLAGILCIYGWYKKFQWGHGYTTCLAVIFISALAAGLIVWMPAVLTKSHGLALLGLFFFCAVVQYQTITHPGALEGMVGSELLHSMDAAGVAGSTGFGGGAGGGGTNPVRDIIAEINLDPFITH